MNRPSLVGSCYGRQGIPPEASYGPGDGLEAFPRSISDVPYDDHDTESPGETSVTGNEISLLQHAEMIKDQATKIDSVLETQKQMEVGVCFFNVTVYCTCLAIIKPLWAVSKSYSL